MNQILLQLSLIECLFQLTILQSLNISQHISKHAIRYRTEKKPNTKKGINQPKAEGITVICLKGCVMSVPPACCTNSAGENVLPWQTQTMLTSDLLYLYRNPLTVSPLLPFVDTYGIWESKEMWERGFGGFPASSPLVSIKGLEFSLDKDISTGTSWFLGGSCLSFICSGEEGFGFGWVSFAMCFLSCVFMVWEEAEALSSGWVPMLLSLELVKWGCSAKEWTEWLWLSVLPPSDKKHVCNNY